MKIVKLLAGILGMILLCSGAMSGCNQEWEVYTGEVEGGPLYSLEEIYEARAIRRRDFLNIAYYNGDEERNKRALRNFEPEPFGELSEEISLKIRECIAKDYRDEGTIPESAAENIIIKKYLGCYNGYYAVRFTNMLTIKPDVETDPEDYIEEVGGIKFCYWRTSQIRFWKEN